MKTFIADKTEKLSKFLKEKYGADMPYSTFMKLLRNKDIKINGARVNKDVGLTVGDEIAVYFDGDNLDFLPVFEKLGVVVFNKPPVLTSEEFEEKLNKKYPFIKLCHRLDRNTSGLLVFASNETSYEEMLKAFKDRTVDKFYKAEVYGKLQNKQATLVSYLKKDEKEGLVKIFNDKVQGSVKIITEYKVIEEYEKTSLLHVKLVTGKTHQIRAHLAHIGHFIVGDGKYGDSKINKELKAKRQKLTAYKIKFNFDKKSPLYELNETEISI